MARDIIEFGSVVAGTLVLLQRFARWWSAALAASMPNRVREWLAVDRHRTVIELLPNGLIVASESCHRETRRITHRHYEGNVPDACRFVTENRLSRWRPIVVRVPVDHCLVRQLQVPINALPHARQIVQLDLASATPLKASAVYSGHLIADATDGSVEQIVFNPGRLGALLGALEGQQLQASHVETVKTEGSRPIKLFPSGRASPTPSPRARQITQLAAVLCAFAVCVIAATAVGELRSDQVRRDELAADVGVLQKAASVARQRIARLESTEAEGTALLRRKVEGRSVLEILEIVSRLLPDDTFLNELQIDSSGLVVDGWSRSAADLTAGLTSAAEIADVSFAAPITRDSIRNAERFRVRLQLRSASKVTP